MNDNNNFFQPIEQRARGWTYPASSAGSPRQQAPADVMNSVTIHHQPNDMNGGGISLTQIYPTPSTQSNNFIFQQPGKYCVSLRTSNPTQLQGQQVGKSCGTGENTGIPLAFLVPNPKEGRLQLIPNVQASSTDQNDAKSPFRPSTPPRTSNSLFKPLGNQRSV